MPDPITGLSIGASLLGSKMQADAASEAAGAQTQAAEAGIAEQRRQFDAMREILKPYVAVGEGALTGMQTFAEAGAPALRQQQALIGLLGPEEERAAIERISGGERFQELTRQGEEGLLQRASATGGLRGGNIQAALGQFRPQLLSSLIDEQYGRLGGLANVGLTTQQNLAKIGQSSAAGVGTGGMESGTNIANLLAQGGAARAGGIKGEATAYGKLLNAPFQFAGFQSGGGLSGPMNFDPFNQIGGGMFF